jgi:hypothetical protein
VNPFGLFITNYLPFLSKYQAYVPVYVRRACPFNWYGRCQGRRDCHVNDTSANDRLAYSHHNTDFDNYIHPVLDDDIDKFDPLGEIPVIDGQWHHVVMMRRDGTSLRVYVDGVEDMGVTNHAESTIPDTYDLSGTSKFNAYIGAITDASDATGATLEKLFAGTIDDVRIYDLALSEAEVAAIASGQ